MSSRLHRRTCAVAVRPRLAAVAGRWWGRGWGVRGVARTGGAGKGQASVCMRTPTGDAPRRSFAVQLWSTPNRYAPGSKLCRYERPSRRQAHSVRRALSYPGGDGGERQATPRDMGCLCRARPQPARSLLPVSVLLQASRRARRGRGSSASVGSPSSSQPRPKPRPPPRTAHPPPVKPRPPLCAAHPRPVKPRPPPYPRNGHFSSISGRQGWSEFHRTRRPTPQGRSEFHPAARLPHATVNMAQTAASHARPPTRWSTTRLKQKCGQGPDGGSDFAAVGWTGHNSDARRSQLAPVTPIRGS